jgi:probable HAF family extracellular repeat protein
MTKDVGVSAVLATLLALLFAPFVAWPQATYTFHQITVPQSMETYVLGINDRVGSGGDILGFYADQKSIGRHFVKYGSAYVTFEIPGLYYFEAQGINNGRVVMGYGLIENEVPNTDPNHLEPTGFAYVGTSKEHPTQALTTLQHPDAEYTIAEGVNDAGAVVGHYYGYSPGAENRPFLWQGGVFSDLPPVDGHRVWPSDINNLGQVVGTVDGPDGVTYGFLYENGQYQFFAHPLSTYFSVSGVNDHSHIVGSYWVYEWHDEYYSCCWRGYLFKDSTFTTINVTNDAQTSVAGINNAGNIAGTFYRPGDGWLAHGFRAVPKKKK